MWKVLLRRSSAAAACLLLVVATKAQYVIGDYGSWNSGTWNTPATWRVYDGSSWATSPTALAAPDSTKNVFIRGSTTVEATFGSRYGAKNLTVEALGRLYNNNTGSTSLSYINIYGSTVRCDGSIGNGATLDGISFNMEAANATIAGSGQFNGARIRKSYNNLNAVSNVIIDMDLTLRFSGGTTTMIYNNCPLASKFNVTINATRTVTLVGSGGSGNLAVDGVDGLGSGNRGGSFTVNGTLYVPGILYLTTDNTSATYAVTFNIGPTGYVRCNQVSGSMSGAGTHTLSISSGGVLEIVGTPNAWSAFAVSASNIYNLAAGSWIVYSAVGAQDVRPVAGGYGGLRLLGTGVKALSGLTVVKGDVEIQNSTGSPVLDVTASNFTLNVAGNWTNYAASGFNERAGIVNFNGTMAAQTITTTGGESFYTWQFAKSTSFPLVTMGSDVSVTNSLALNTGAIELNGNQLAILNPATTAINTNSSFGTIRHIRGERTDNTSRVRWDIGSATGAHLVPFGTPSGYTPITFNLIAGNAGSVTMATYGTGANNLPWPTTPTAVTSMSGLLFADNTAAVVDRFWEVDVTGTPTATLTLSYKASELPASPYDDATLFRAQRWNGSAWESQLAGSGSAYAIVAANVSSFGPFAGSPTSSPLPVELLRFDAWPADEHVDIAWTTASERNSAWFVVERSTDLLTWSELDRLQAAGTSEHVIDYTNEDPTPANGWNYYRLTEIDADGTARTSNAVAVFFSGSGNASAPVIHPNPVHDVASVRWSGASGDAMVHARLIDASGRIVLDREVPPSAELRLTLGGVPAGVYTLSLECAGVTGQARLVVE